jgi:hypothetical protein
MSYREKYQQQKEDLLSRQKEQVEAPRTTRWGSIILREKVPAGINIWIEGEGTKKIDIIPFPAGPNHPMVILGRIPVGKFVYDIEIVEHTNIGVNNDAWACNSANFREPDSICTYIKQKRLPKEEWTKLKGKRRNIYLIWDHTTPEEENKGVQIWLISYKFFGEKIDEIVKIPGRMGTAGVIPFYDPDIGKSIIYTKKVKDKTNFDYLGHRFVDRASPIPDDILKQADFHLDECIKTHPTFEEVYQSFYGKPFVEGTVHVPLHLAGTQQLPAAGQGQQVNTPTATPPVITNGAVAGLPSDDVPLDFPAGQQAPTVPQAAQTTEVPPATPRLMRGTTLVCPAGGTFGADFNMLEMCQDQSQCTIWDNCADAAMRQPK